LIKTSSRIIEKRVKFVNDFIDFFRNIYKFLSDGKETVNIEYIPYGLNESDINSSINKDEISELYKSLYKEIKKSELGRGITLLGCQKDDLRILINGGNAKEIASQGQHKSLQISLKLAEFNYLKSIKRETPVLLLDDVFSELDSDRCNKVIEIILKNDCQTFITTTDIDLIRNKMNPVNKFRYFRVEEGNVIVLQ
jgi:DNA replication and repair protein RecF